ncbi:MAG: inositol-3-phosphate synthase [Thermodesulfobacteriota bacterium]|jgi:myo-inositol-1-phosphate synthase
MGRTIRIAIVGVGNCASSLLQGIEYYRHAGEEERTRPTGLMHYDIGGYTPSDIEAVCAFDIDARKVDRPLNEAAFAKPNNTKLIWPDLPHSSVTVHMGPVIDGVSPHMEDYPEDRRFVIAKRPAVDVVHVLRESRADILLNYLPVGSQQAAEFYAKACLEAGVSLVNCMPVFLVSDAEWAEAFRRRGIPIVGDDIKSQLGATILHRALAQLFVDRGVKITRTYQLNTGGNTDFLNMLNRSRLSSKKRSKTNAVQSVLPEPLPDDQVHIGPSDYVPWQQDQKIGFLRLEGRIFGNVPIELEARLVVEDSPNSAGVVIDVIRCCQLARDRGISGPLTSISAYSMKHPPQQLPDTVARDCVERFIRGEIER